MAFRSDLLLARLKAAGKTRKFLTAVTGRSERTVSRWLNDGKPPKREDLLVIARNLDCAPEDFDPDFAEEGQGDVPIHAKVSVASHNAFEMMCSRYDVTQRDIIELAPVLFSIVAAHALRVPAVDEANWQRTERLGLVAARPQSQTEIHPDQQASADKKCFGLSTQDQYAVSRNLFHEAVRRLCLDIGDHVSAENHVRPWPGEAPTAAGFIADVWLMNELTGGDETLIRALTQGGIHIAKFDEDLRRPQKATAANFQRWLRREVESRGIAFGFESVNGGSCG